VVSVHDNSTEDVADGEVLLMSSVSMAITSRGRP